MRRDPLTGRTCGYFSWPAETFTSGGYAIAMKTVDISDAPLWAFGDAGLDAVRVEAHSDRPLFIGIARAADLKRYLLRGTEHDEVSGLELQRIFAVLSRPSQEE